MIVQAMPYPAAGGGGGGSDRWRILIDTAASGGTLSIQEVEMMDTIGGSDLCTGGSSSASAGTAANAFDGSTGTAWVPGGGGAGEWIEYAFASSLEILQITIKPNGSTNGPVAFSVQFYNYGSSSWETAWSEVAQTWSSTTMKTFVSPVDGAASGWIGSRVYDGQNAAVTVSLLDVINSDGRRVRLQENDLVLVCHFNARNANVGDTNLLISGFTDVLAGTDLYQNHNNDSNMMVQYKFMGSTPDTSFTAPASGGSGEGFAGIVHVFRGINTTTPIDVTPQYVLQGASAQPNPPSITPATAGAIIYCCGGASVGNGVASFGFDTPSDLSSTTNHWRTWYTSAGTEEPVVGAGIKTDWTSGAFDAATFTGHSNASDRTAIAVSLALRPA